ncbi:MAG: helix-turn-helix transcriptional regulator [Oscillospiraceae bacterium]|nr:helix-turn-helix transcriptional regulator [Oscillospiraceae bacterium]
MSIEMIGKQIASMRKEKGIKQEELAKFVGVSAQAVSKWENGGVPDTELLPKIADFFSVSVDSLFGRNITDYSDLREAICKKIIDTPNEQRFKAVFNYCWDMERALYGHIPKDGSIEDYERELGKQEQRYSSIMSDYGFTRMGVANKLQYFLLVPEIQNTDTAIFEGVDYLTFFKDFSDKDVFDACVFLNKRDSDKAFTENLFVKNLKIEADKAKQIIVVLEKYNLLYKTQIEMDDETQTVYNFKPTPSFIAFLIFAREMIKTPNNFSYYSGGRNKPYLK